MSAKTGQTGQTPPAHEELTPEQYKTLAPLLALGTVGNPEMAEQLKPAQIRRQERKERFLSNLRQHGTIQHAATATGVSRATVYAWRDSDPAFEEQVKEWLEEDMEHEVVESMFALATNTDPKTASAAVRAGEFLLKGLNRSKWGDQLSVDTRHELNVNVQITTELKDRRRLALQELERSNVPTVDAEFRVLEQALEAEQPS